MADRETVPDAVVLYRIRGLLEQRFPQGDVQGQESRRRQVASLILGLSPPAATALLLRLQVSDPRDPYTRPFRRLPPAQREEIVETLRRASLTASLIKRDPGLSPVVAKRLYLAEVREAVAHLGALASGEQYDRALQALAALRQARNDPRFTGVDRTVLDTVTAEADRLNTLLRGPITALMKPASTRTAAAGVLAIPVGVLGAQALGADVAAAATAAAGLALGVGVVAIATVLVIRHYRSRVPLIGSTEAQRLNHLMSLAQALGELRRTVEIEAARAPAPDSPAREVRADPVVPPVDAGPDDEDRKPCRQQWVPRPYGSDWRTNYHHDYATAVVVRRRFPGVSPEMERRIYRGGVSRLDFDSYDPAEDAYYEFKTRHQILRSEWLKRADKTARLGWMARARLLFQAEGQRKTLLDCGLYHAKLIWVFQEKDVADNMRPYLADFVDRVMWEPWDGKN
jgi:hypothetical protein